jgi:hypothetical protein
VQGGGPGAVTIDMANAVSPHAPYNTPGPAPAAGSSATALASSHASSRLPTSWPVAASKKTIWLWYNTYDGNKHIGIPWDACVSAA